MGEEQDNINGVPAYIIDKVNQKQTPDFQRMRSPYRKFIPAWEDENSIATNKVGVAEDEKGPFIYNEVQDNGKGGLIDYTDPKVNKGDRWMGYDKAIERGDTIHINSVDDGIKFSENYKKVYTGFDSPKENYKRWRSILEGMRKR